MDIIVYVFRSPRDSSIDYLHKYFEQNKLLFTVTSTFAQKFIKYMHLKCKIFIKKCSKTERVKIGRYRYNKIG